MAIKIFSEDKVYHITDSECAFVHMYNQDAQVGYLVKIENDIRDVVREVQKYFPRGHFNCKIIGNYALNRKLQYDLSGLGGMIEKAIYATGFDIFYNPKQNSIKMHKFSYQKINVLIVDDSKTIREILRKTLSTDPMIQVVGEAESGQGLVNLIREKEVHVVTLDMQMPVVNGLMGLKQFYPQLPVATVVVSAVSLEEGSLAMEAMEAGATDYIQKPMFDNIASFQIELIEKVKTAFESKISPRKHEPVKIKIEIGSIDQDRLIVIGSSTGGTEALRNVLTQLPKNIPPILIVQHIPAGFSKAFAERMNSLCPFEVKEAVDGDEVLPGKVLVAPGGFQMALVQNGGRLSVAIKDDPPVNRHKPSVDYLFETVSKIKSKKVVSVILTGMGADGAKGMKLLKDTIFAQTIAQNEESCVVFGMPAAAIKLGCVDKISHLDEIAAQIVSAVTLSSRKVS